ncbi:MAG: c-type cytochrome [Armatimonadetes bacterium]|nr:c-type cytochrome [Armatimonadota bacterium]
MTDVDQPYQVHPGDYLNQHDVNTFGCTVCHRGQGRAMKFEEAVGIGYHWDYPMLPAGLTQSSCGLCHSAAEVATAGGELYAEGKEMFDTKGCASCHKLNGRGGNLGPELDKVGVKVSRQVPMKFIEGDHTLPQWLMEHFQDPQKIVEDSQMKPPGLTDDEIMALTTYMLSLQGRDLPSTYLSPEKHLEMYRMNVPLDLSGEELFKKFCATCHDSGEVGGYDKFFKKYMPAVRGPTYLQIATVEYLEANIKQGHPETLMPSWSKGSGGLTDEEVRRISEFLLSGDTGAHALPASAVARAQDVLWATPGDVRAGRRIFTKQCVGCHGLDAAGLLGPSLNTKVFQSAASDGFIYTTIAYGRRNAAMPGFLGDGALTEEQVEDLVAFVRSLVGDKAPQGAEEERP